MDTASRGGPSAVPPAALRRLAEAPWIRPDAVARGRARLAQPHAPTALELAGSMIERLAAERVC
jgi:hypothetical protein